MGTRASLAANSSSVASMSDKREVLSWMERLTNKQTNMWHRRRSRRYRPAQAAFSHHVRQSLSAVKYGYLDITQKL